MRHTSTNGGLTFEDACPEASRRARPPGGEAIDTVVPVQGHFTDFRRLLEHPAATATHRLLARLGVASRLAGATPAG